MTSRKLPIGIQGFEKLRDQGFVYVDKTEYVYELAHSNLPYFLSRPRRFGKSLLLSTLKAYFEGKRELFIGLKIEELESDNPDAWREYPVFYFDFNGEEYSSVSIEEVLDQHLREWEEKYGAEYRDSSLGYRFQKLLEKAAHKTGLRCVVLVDEYDKPLLEVIENDVEEEHIKKVFKGFFSRLKKADEFVQFIFITGVSKFHKVSIFSDLNQLKDISLTSKYASVCGITEDEIKFYFDHEIAALADNRNMTKDECLDELKRTYDGYHFHPDSDGVYNPYSLLNALADGELGSYWYETGTPTFLVKRLREIDFDIRKFTDRTLYASESILKDYTGDSTEAVPLLYQTGYLTIADFDPEGREYTLAFPNEEVKYGFIESLMPEYVSDCGAGSGKDIFTLRRYRERGEIDSIRDVLTALFAGITYTVKEDPFEHYFQSVIYLVFTLLDKFAECEMHTFTGRVDCRVETKRFVYLFEFKRDDTAEAALRQIDDKEYTLPFVADSRKIFKIGVSFDSSTRMLTDWKVSE